MRHCYLRQNNVNPHLNLEYGSSSGDTGRKVLVVAPHYGAVTRWTRENRKGGTISCALPVCSVLQAMMLPVDAAEGWEVVETDDASLSPEYGDIIGVLEARGLIRLS